MPGSREIALREAHASPVGSDLMPLSEFDGELEVAGVRRVYLTVLL